MHTSHLLITTGRFTLLSFFLGRSPTSPTFWSDPLQVDHCDLRVGDELTGFLDHRCRMLLKTTCAC